MSKTFAFFMLALGLLGAGSLWVAARTLQFEVAARAQLEAPPENIVPRQKDLGGQPVCPDGFHVWPQDPALCERDGTATLQVQGPIEERGRSAPCSTDNGQECVVCDVDGEHWVELGAICHQDPRERVWQ